MQKLQEVCAYTYLLYKITFHDYTLMLSVCVKISEEENFPFLQFFSHLQNLSGECSGSISMHACCYCVANKTKLKLMKRAWIL